MKRFSVLLCLLLLFPLHALAAQVLRFQEPVYEGLHGRSTTVLFSRTRNGPDGTALLLDETGKVLGSIRMPASRKEAGFTIALDEGMPLGQTLQLVFRTESGEETIQDTCLLAVDAPQHDGIRQVSTTEKKIAITFDTSNGEGRMDRILDLLDRYQAKCTFFVQGEFIFTYPHWIEQMDARGHEIGNHSMHHPDMRQISNVQIYREITQCNQLIEEITGKKVVLYRPPSGYFTHRDRSIARALGSEMVLWTFDSHDGFAEDSEETVWRLMKQKSAPGVIILMHIYGQHTLPILDRYLPMMQEQGYEFVTVSELLQCAQTQTSAPE